MKNLSKDIEIAIMDAINGMTVDINVLDVDDDKLGRLMKSRIDAFSSTKEMIVLWDNSQNSPNNVKLRYYVEKLIVSGENTINVLRQTLRRKIKFSELDLEKHGTAIGSKPVIFRAINEINSGVIELKMQLESDKIDLKNREFQRGFPEKFANQEFFPEKDYYKEWYNEPEDAIMICPKGTKGEIIVLDNLRIQLPAIPTSKKKILFSDLPIEEQYWRRPEQPKGLSPETEEMYTDYILEEFRRRREGVHFMNKGKAIWLCPAHYMGLVHNQMLDTGGYKDFRWAQCQMYYFTLACIVDPRSVGELFIKGRRTGFTEEIIDFFENDSTSMKNALMGMTSKTGSDAQEAFLKYSYGIQNQPFYFRPVVKGKIDDRNKMEFGKPSDNTKESKKLRATSTEDYLNTKVDWMNTVTLAYDSKRLKRYLGDEFSKWEKPLNYIDHWGNIKPTMLQGGRVVGKAFLGSTMNPLDKGGREAITLYYGSDITKRNPNGRTATGLYSFFLPAHKNMEDYTDKYGYCHEVLSNGEFFFNSQGVKKTIGSLQYLESEFASAKTMGGKAYNNARRLDPITIEDAFRDEIDTQLFDIEKINSQLNYNRRCDIQKTLVRGNFEWKDGIKDGTVIWAPKDNGRFLISWIPAQELNLTNRFVKKNIFGDLTKCPVNDNLGAFGCDPYDQSAVIDSKLVATENGVEHNLGSKGALHGYLGTNIGDIPSQQFFLEYIARPKDADMFFEDVLMACLFYSMPIIVENNKKLLLKHFKVRGYRGFCLTRFDKDPSRLSQDEKELGGLPNSSEDIKNYHWTSIEKYIIDYVGEYSPEPGEQEIREVGAMGVMPFNRTLSDWLKFNINKRTDFDASISSGFALMGVNRHKYKPVVERKPVSISFKKMS
jgi:hypothetical protein